jgi:hypothetical protein
MVKTIKEWQTLISALTVAGSLLLFAFKAGKAVQQHEQIIEMQSTMLQIITSKCK